MSHRMLGAFTLVVLITCSAVAQGETCEPDGTCDVRPSGPSGTMGVPAASWESWLLHGTLGSTLGSQVLPQGPDLSAAAASLSAATEFQARPLGSEPGAGSAGVRQITELHLSETWTRQAGVYRGF